jgi:hypothetical protein
MHASHESGGARGGEKSAYRTLATARVAWRRLSWPASWLGFPMGRREVGRRFASAGKPGLGRLNHQDKRLGGVQKLWLAFGKEPAQLAARSRETHVVSTIADRVLRQPKGSKREFHLRSQTDLTSEFSPPSGEQTAHTPLEMANTRGTGLSLQVSTLG